MHRSRRALSAIAALSLVGAIAGCSTTVSLTPAPRANDPACAAAMVQVPAVLAGQDRRWTNAQATAAWGSSAGSSIIVTCGLEPPGPSTLACRTVRGVDWIIDESEAPSYRVTTFGRAPAIQVYLDNEVVSSAEVLDRLSVAAQSLPQTGSVCTDRPAS